MKYLIAHLSPDNSSEGAVREYAAVMLELATRIGSYREISEMFMEKQIDGISKTCSGLMAFPKFAQGGHWMQSRLPCKTLSWEAILSR